MSKYLWCAGEIEMKCRETKNEKSKFAFAYLITLFGSTPQFAAITTFGSACSILVQSSLAANPLNIEKCLRRQWRVIQKINARNVRQSSI